MVTKLSNPSARQTEIAKVASRLYGSEITPLAVKAMFKAWHQLTQADREADQKEFEAWKAAKLAAK